MLVGCLPRGRADTDDADPMIVPVTITSLDVTCDLDDATWTIAVAATGWSGGAQLYWTADGDWVESHYVRSVSQAPDGSTDQLELDLDIVGDWREQASGSSTAIHCTDDPGLRLFLFELDGDVADCLELDAAGKLAGTDVAGCDA